MKDNDPLFYDPTLLNKLRENSFKYDTKNIKIIETSQYANEWKDKCERTLLLAKNLGNIYTGSLYNGLLSLICDESVDLSGKKILLFSYGSGCAASMFCAHVRENYKQSKLTKNSSFI
jgi:hydroxymethylglutaryl-CoA synthase